MRPIPKNRIGKTFQCKWAITTNGEPTSLEGRDLTLMLIDPMGISTKVQFTIERENTISFTFQGKDQKKLGKYMLSLYENKDKLNQTVVDVDAFILVDYTYKES